MLNTLHHRYRHRQGFTIVELLIVIVVIAILAAITIVAFNGIQRRAQTAQYVSVADSVEKAIRAKLITDTRVSEPNLDDYNLGDDIFSYICAAREADLPETSDFEAGQCLKYDFGGSVQNGYANDAMYDLLFKGTDTSVSPSVLPVASLNVGAVDVKSRAIAILMALNVPIGLVWMSPDTSSCGRGIGSLGVTSELDNIGAVLRGEKTPADVGLPPEITNEELLEFQAQLQASGDLCMVLFSS